VDSAYRCFLPDLTGFTGHCCTGPDNGKIEFAIGELQITITLNV